MDTGAGGLGRRSVAANKSAVRDFAERNFKGHQDLLGLVGRLAL
jgi:hypothetical protein